MPLKQCSYCHLKIEEQLDTCPNCGQEQPAIIQRKTKTDHHLVLPSKLPNVIRHSVQACGLVCVLIGVGFYLWYKPINEDAPFVQYPFDVAPDQLVLNDSTQLRNARKDIVHGRVTAGVAKLEHIAELTGPDRIKANLYLGLVYAQGLGVNPSYTKAHEFFRKAAIEHNPTALVYGTFAGYLYLEETRPWMEECAVMPITAFDIDDLPAEAELKYLMYKTGGTAMEVKQSQQFIPEPALSRESYDFEEKQWKYRLNQIRLNWLLDAAAAGHEDAQAILLLTGHVPLVAIWPNNYRFIQANEKARYGDCLISIAKGEPDDLAAAIGYLRRLNNSNNFQMRKKSMELLKSICTAKNTRHARDWYDLH